MVMIIEGTTTYKYWTNPEKCWQLVDSNDSAEIIRVSCGNTFIVLKSELVYHHSDRGKAVYKDRIKILKVGIKK